MQNLNWDKLFQANKRKYQLSQLTPHVYLLSGYKCSLVILNFKIIMLVVGTLMQS